jgi:hypothetical protein
VKNIHEKIDEKTRADSLYISSMRKPDMLAEQENEK